MATAYVLINCELGSEEAIIEQLKSNKPEYIVYSSEINWFKERNNAPNAKKYILDNYFLFNQIKYWQIYKIIK